MLIIIMNCLSANDMRNDQSVEYLLNAVNSSVIYNTISNKIIVLRQLGIFYLSGALPPRNKLFFIFFPIYDNMHDAYKLYVKYIPKQCGLIILLQNNNLHILVDLNFKKNIYVHYNKISSFNIAFSCLLRFFWLCFIIEL